MDKSAIAKDVGVSSKAISSWLAVLDASNQVLLLEPWFENIGKRIVKTPKLFLSDTGFACYLLGLDVQSLARSSFIGSLWETLVYSELRKLLGSRNFDRRRLWFYRDNQGKEIDFLLTRGDRGLFIECKWSENPTLKDAKSAIAVRDYLYKRPQSSIKDITILVVCRTPETTKLAEGVYGINPYELGVWLERSLNDNAS